jgi:excisionase family DNA binding protein
MIDQFVKHSIQMMDSRQLTDDPSSDLMTVQEGSEFLRLKPSTLRSWILKRRIPYVKLGRVFFRRSDLEKLIAESVVEAAPRS